MEKRGILGHLKARIRAEVFNALDDESESRPSLSHENLLINELIREYLEFNKYKYTASVLIAGKRLLLVTGYKICFSLLPILRKSLAWKSNSIIKRCHLSDWDIKMLVREQS